MEFQLQWDDYWVVINRFTDKGFQLENLINVITDYYHGQYAPINELYYIIVKSVFGYDAKWFHICGLMIHILNACLVHYLISKVYKLSSFDDGDVSKTSATITAIVFAIHPINLEAVAWIAASKILIYGFFYLCAMIFYLDYIRTKKYRYFTLTLAMFIFSFGGKEQAVTLPSVLILLDWLSGRPLSDTKLWVEKIPFIALSLFFGFVTLKSQGDYSGYFNEYSIYERIILSFFTLWEYVVKCIIPVKLSFAYPFPFSSSENIPIWLFCYPVIIITILSFSLRSIFRSKKVSFVIIFFSIHLFLVLNIVNINRHSIIADRYAYLSTISIGLFVAMLFNRYLLSYRFTKILIPLYIILLSGYTFFHLPTWKNSGTLKNELGNKIRSRQDYEQLKKLYDIE